MKKVLAGLFCFFLLVSTVSLIFNYQERKHNQKIEKLQESYNEWATSQTAIAYNQGYEKGEEDQYLKAKYGRKNIAENQIIQSTANYSINNYSISLEKDVGDRVGFTWTNNNTIKIETNRTIQEIHESCNHEVTHNLFPKFEHPEGEAKYSDPIYVYSEDLKIETCDQLIYKLN